MNKRRVNVPLRYIIFILVFVCVGLMVASVVSPQKTPVRPAKRMPLSVRFIKYAAPAYQSRTTTILAFGLSGLK